MKQRTWVIIGATSVIAQQFAHLVAAEGHNVRLVGRDSQQLHLIANDLMLRYQIICETQVIDMTAAAKKILTALDDDGYELDLFFAQSDFTHNSDLTNEGIARLIQINITATVLLTNAYLELIQKQHHILYLSSVAACRGRSKNSLYGGSKAAVDVYLEGLQQQASTSQQITIARLGFIDTRQTYGVTTFIKPAAPKDCAKACLKALRKNRKTFFYPRIWFWVMHLVKCLPFFVYRKMAGM